LDLGWDCHVTTAATYLDDYSTVTASGFLDTEVTVSPRWVGELVQLCLDTQVSAIPYIILYSGNL